MSQGFPQSEQYDEIDLSELVLNVWDGKWLIAGITIIFVGLGVLAAYVAPTNFSARLEIHKIPRAISVNYDELNLFGFFNVSQDLLLTKLMSKLNNRIIIKNNFEFYKYLDKSNFENDSQYNYELSSLTKDVTIIAPLSDEEYTKDKKAVRRSNHWDMTFEGKYREKFLLVIEKSLEQASASIRQELIDQFNTKINISKLQTKNAIADLDAQISNALTDYDKTTARRLAFLREQAVIARKLDVAKPSEFLSAIDDGSDSPFYMRGYNAIEQEVEHLESRSDKTLFVSELVELEGKRRTLMQDPLLERVQAAFKKSPVFTNVGFAAAEYDVGSIEFEFSNTRMVLIGVSGILGLFAGLFVLMMRNLLRSRKPVPS